MTTPAVPSLTARFFARAIDFIVLGAIGGAVGRVFDYGFAWLVATAISTYLYFVVADALFGKTIGKAAFKLHVEDEHGAKPSWKAAFARELFVIFGAIPFIGPLLALGAWIGIAVTARKNALGQGWHDRFGKTKVAR